MLRPARRPVLLRHLLTHTSGFVYENWDANLVRYLEQAGPVDPDTGMPVPPLMFEPGTRWEYGTNMDWAGRLVEAVSGQTLEEYFQRNILRPLGMKDTSFIVPEDKFDRLVNVWQRQSDGSLKEQPRTPLSSPQVLQRGRRIELDAQGLRAFHADDSAARARERRATDPPAANRRHDGIQPDRRPERGEIEERQARKFE